VCARTALPSPGVRQTRDCSTPGVGVRPRSGRMAHTAERMKMREQHIVPLRAGSCHSSGPASGHRPQAMLPQARNASRPITQNTLKRRLAACAIRRISSRAWLRSTASTRSMSRVNRDAIERQLAHGERDKSRDSYNAAQYCGSRKMMQAGRTIWMDRKPARAQ